MNLDLKKFIVNLQKEKDIKKIKKMINNFTSDTSICDSYVNEGSFGRVFISRIPSIVKLNDDIFEYPIVKIEKDNGLDSSTTKENKNHRFLIKNGYLHFITNNSMIGEALASVMLTNLFISRITPHVVVFLGHSHCNNTDMILYENLTYNDGKYSDFEQFINYMGKVTDKMIETIIIQVLHTFMILNEKYSLIHFDFEDRNLFIKIPNKNENYYGTDILSHDYLVYKIDSEKSIYLKNPGFLIKVGDFGGACLKISNKLTVQNNFENDNNSIKLSQFYPKYPNSIKKFLPDTYPFIRFLILKFGINIKILYRLATEVPILSTLVINEDSQSSVLPNYTITKSELNKVQSPRELLSSSIFENYHKEPNDMKSPLFIG